MPSNVFLSTLSLRRATIVIFRKRDTPSQFLSTLSLRRATCYSLRHSTQGRYFYPRSPCGERQFKYVVQCRKVIFLSTLSLRRATASDKRYAYCIIISIHALLAESDAARRGQLWQRLDFYPRSPCGERRLDVTIIGRTWDISIHALLAESDHDTYVIMEATKVISIHALLAESDISPKTPSCF